MSAVGTDKIKIEELESAIGLPGDWEWFRTCCGVCDRHGHSGFVGMFGVSADSMVWWRGVNKSLLMRERGDDVPFRPRCDASNHHLRVLSPAAMLELADSARARGRATIVLPE